MTKKGFDQKYWDANYSKMDEMDGIGNVKEHVDYIHSVFALEQIDISSIADFGFGTGHLFKALLKKFIPYKAYGIEPSNYMFKKTSAKKLSPVPSTKIKIENIDLLTWARKKKHFHKRFDLGVCTSVLQYLSVKEINEVLPVLAQRVKYLYLTVPTDVELDRQIAELEFHDTYAKRRTQKKYLKLLSPHFTIVSNKILESKVHFDQKDTFFCDLLYRF
ncbi:MAG: class I SAM-dependent methyltransferase [Halobacteriovoraceae bacterium]|nr:class I SAM-dependent methyltransferase [Halobacteriovoraceae bacterium]